MSNVRIEDALAKEDVVITVLVQPAEVREERPCLVSVGIADKRVVMRTGKFGQLGTLIDQAWAEYAAVVVDTAEPELEVIAEGEVGEGDTAVFAYSDEDF